MENTQQPTSEHRNNHRTVTLNGDHRSVDGRLAAVSGPRRKGHYVPEWYTKDQYTGDIDNPPSPAAYGLPADFRPSQVREVWVARTGTEWGWWPAR
jgi:hypothetical protein